MKITLIIPPSAFLLDERVFPSLGILRVAAVLERVHDVDVIDLSGVSNYLEAVADYFRNKKPDAVGITSTTPQFPFVKKIVEEIWRHNDSAKLILGGPHATLCYAGLRTNPDNTRAEEAVRTIESLFDVVCLGDGEISVFEAIKEGAPKVVDADNRKSGMFLTDYDYEALPIPARHLIDMSSYRYSIDGYPATSIISQLGCPFNCSFCGGRNSPSLRVTRNRTIQGILDEINWLNFHYGIKGFMFYDDELNVNKEIIELMDRIKNFNDDLRFRGFIKSELFTDEQAEAMYRAGFRWVLCGFESADPGILENINKRATVDDNTRAVEIAHRHGLKVKALMSIGHPGESIDTVSETRNWLVDVGVDDFDCTVISAYPGTPYYDEAVNIRSGVWRYTAKSGDKLYMYDVDYSETSDYYKGDPDGGYKSYVYTDYITRNDIAELRDWVEDSVRINLDIPFNPARPGLRYEHSSGGHLPKFILRTV